MAKGAQAIRYVRDAGAETLTRRYLRCKVRQEFEILKDALFAQGQLDPAYALHPAAVATRGLFWSSNYVEESDLYLAAEQTGVRLPPDAVRRVKDSCSTASITYREAEYAGSVSLAFHLPLERTVEFLVAAGIFVRVP